MDRLCCSRGLSLGLAGDGPLEILLEASDTRDRLQISKERTTRQQRVRRRSGGDRAQPILGINESSGGLD